MDAPSQVVWKFPLDLTAQPQPIDVPSSTPPLHIAWFQGRPTLWFLVERPDAPTTRWFRIAATGEPVPPAHAARHHGSVIQEGTYVWHIFELFIPAHPMSAEPGIVR